MKKSLLTLLALMGLTAGDVLANDSRVAVPDGGQLIIAVDTLTPAAVEGDKMALAEIQSIPATELPTNVSVGLRVGTPAGFTADWDVVTRAPLRKAIRKGDVMLATFQARCHESMTGEAVIQFAFERNGEPYNKSAYMRFGVRETWTTFYVPFIVDDNYAPDEAHATFHMGFDGQVVDLADLRVVNYRDTLTLTDLPRSEVNYAGRAADSPWRAEADARIEKNRKADASITVRDADGQPIPGVTVRFTQTRHAFPFGTAIAVPGLLDPSADGDRYREVLKDDFNAGVFENAMKWYNHDVATLEETDRALAWLLDAGFEMRGHVLVWPGWEWLPKSLKALADNPAALKAAAEQRVTETATHFRGKLVDWDVLNEPFTNHDLMDILGNEVMVDWFKLAEAADPDTNRYLNDWGILTTGGRPSPHQQHFEDTIQYLIDQGAPITGIGMQGHFGGTLTAPRDIWKVLDRYSRFDLPIKITELDIDLNDPALQADFMRDVLTAAFAHESVVGVTVWGFWAKRHWRASAAHYDPDWNRRPVGEVWKQLTQETWSTDEQSQTDVNGQALFRGFKGDYNVVITFDDGTTHTKNVKLGDDGIDLSIDTTG
ncbi:MAG: endo-1,4-beta-xylanase [Planctomycetota bacterium]